MNEKLYYEKTGVSLPDEVKAAYEYAVENNYKHYRAVSKTGTYYGYVNGRVVHADAGQEWFENSQYKAPSVNLQTERQSEALALEDNAELKTLENEELLVSSNKEPVIEINDSVKVEDEPLAKESEIPDYKTMYEKDHKELVAIKAAIATIVKVFRAADEKLKEDE